MQIPSVVFVVAIFGIICLPTTVHCGVSVKDVRDNPDLLHKAILDEHNRLRNKEAIEENASYMYKMASKQTLIDYAQNYVDNCIYKHSGGSFGENLFITIREDDTIAYVVQQWYNEKKDYTYSDKSCTLGEKCGHYTQVVWGESKYLGCGLKFCSTIEVHGDIWNDAYLVSCSYGPRGNYAGHPYEIGNKACEKCPDNCIDSGLCETDFTIKLCKDRFTDCAKYKANCNNNARVANNCCKTCKGTGNP